MRLLPALALAAFGAVAVALPAQTDDPAASGVQERRLAHQRGRQAAEVRARFDQAVLMLHAKRYDHAAAALHRVLELAPALPEAHVNMGFALLGTTRYREARDFFASAIELRPTQANAYYGLALAEEGSGDLPAALGAMRGFLHLSRADDSYRPKARAALWEWETALGRGNAQVAIPATAQGEGHGR